MEKKYRSPSTQEPATAAQFVAEVLITRKYSKKNIKLPHRFWNEPKYKKEFIKTIQRVNSLLKVYNETAVVRVFFTDVGKYIYSVGYPGLAELIEREEEKLKSKENIKPKIENKDVSLEQPKKQTGTKSIRTKLRELE